MTECEARERYGASIQVVRAQFAANDRARAEGVARGGIKVITDRRGRVLGADLLGAHAGELVGLWGLAITRRLSLGALTGVIFPYPTLGEIAKASASAFFAPKLFSPGPRRLVRLLSHLP
jgi:pyruvate/2-oxoglutarate dehydrogenase complex dihydrolipoamide dehydrogenase (E3) component